MDSQTLLPKPQLVNVLNDLDVSDPSKNPTLLVLFLVTFGKALEQQPWF
jgi:hypothetical protein